MKRYLLFAILLMSSGAWALMRRKPAAAEEVRGIAADWTATMSSANAGNKVAAVSRRDALFFGIIGCVSRHPSGTPLVFLSAEQGLVEAGYRVGFIYLVGRGAPVDHAAALCWLEKANDGGSVEAQDLLATMYIDGQGVQRDPEKGTALLKEVVRRGSVDAEVTSVDLLRRGHRRSLDKSKAAELMDAAATHGHPYAQGIVWLVSP